MIALGNYNNIDQQFNTHDFLKKSSLSIWYMGFVITTYILDFHVYFVLCVI